MTGPRTNLKTPWQEPEPVEQPKAPIPKTREQMIEYLVRRAYPLKKKRDGKGGSWRSFYDHGKTQFEQSLRSQSDRVIEAMHDSAIKEQDRRRTEANDRKQGRRQR